MSFFRSFALPAQLGVPLPTASPVNNPTQPPRLARNHNAHCRQSYPNDHTTSGNHVVAIEEINTELGDAPAGHSQLAAAE